MDEYIQYLDTDKTVNLNEEEIAKLKSALNKITNLNVALSEEKKELGNLEAKFIEKGLSIRQDPSKLLKILDRLEGEKERQYSTLAELKVFQRRADVDEYIQYLDTDKGVNLQEEERARLKSILEGFKAYMAALAKDPFGLYGVKYIDKIEELLQSPDPSKVRGEIRKVLGTYLGSYCSKDMEVVERAKLELWLTDLEKHFNAIPELHEGINFADVEKSLRADPVAMKKLFELDKMGHEMNVFGEENGEYIFASGWRDEAKIMRINEQYFHDNGEFAYDQEYSEYAWKNLYNYRLGRVPNAVSLTRSLGVDMADSSLHEKLRKAVPIKGRAWLKTDPALRKEGIILMGYGDGIYEYDANNFVMEFCPFRVAMRVKVVRKK